MQQIADWLESLGMSEYAQRFAENGINVAALPHLTDQDLKDIGVLPRPHRPLGVVLMGLWVAAAARAPTRAPCPHPWRTGCLCFNGSRCRLLIVHDLNPARDDALRADLSKCFGQSRCRRFTTYL